MKKLSARLSTMDNAVLPGFYGSMPNGEVKHSAEVVLTLQVLSLHVQSELTYTRIGQTYQVSLLLIQES